MSEVDAFTYGYPKWKTCEPFANDICFGFFYSVVKDFAVHQCEGDAEEVSSGEVVQRIPLVYGVDMISRYVMSESKNTKT